MGAIYAQSKLTTLLGVLNTESAAEDQRGAVRAIGIDRAVATQ